MYTKDQFLEHYGNLDVWKEAAQEEDVERGFINSSSSSEEDEDDSYISERPPLDPSTRHRALNKNFSLSDRVMATFEQGDERRLGTIVAINAEGTYDILFDDGNKEASIPRSRIFATETSENGYYSSRQDNNGGRRLSARSGTSSMTASSFEVTKFQQSLNQHFGGGRVSDGDIV